MDDHSEKIWVAIPAMAESKWLPQTLSSLSEQSINNFNVVVCVNQPDSWWRDPLKINICINNKYTIEKLNADKNKYPFKLHILDRSSPGMGWKKNKGGAGIARRAVMDAASHKGGDDCLLVSADADTIFDKSYLEDVIVRFAERQDALALSSPYYHPLSGDDIIDSSMLCYETFMRFYLLNLIRIKSPYAYTALGSAIAMPQKTYRKIKGVPLKNSGEDFYLLQKIAKIGKILLWIPSKVYPATRLSERTAFGTGKALAKDRHTFSDHYPVIHPGIFDEVYNLYNCFEKLFIKDVKTPLDDILKELFVENNIWSKLRDNSNSETTFIKACHQKIDGLRIWQIVRRLAKDDCRFKAFYANTLKFFPQTQAQKVIAEQKQNEQIKHLVINNSFRNSLFNIEDKMRKQFDAEKIF